MNTELIVVCILAAIVFIVFMFIKTPQGRGIVGELSVKIILGKTKEGEKYIINNFMLVDNGKSSQIDHILINQNGVFVIETKNYSGRIYGNQSQQEWTQVLSYGKIKHKLYNPIKQNATHIYRLKKLLPEETYIKSVVVFVQNNTKYIQAQGVLNLGQLAKCIKTSGDHSLCPSEMSNIYNLLLKAKNECSVTNWEHIAKIETMKENIQNNICPRCGGNLVERNGKYGMFYGCENYPKCEFIKR
ncbi:MAG TPA: NERD domain-containing protein [Clostridia bacterium]|nr:NERD domain-containing protein [Clostridia bacterium]